MVLSNRKRKAFILSVFMIWQSSVQSANAYAECFRPHNVPGGGEVVQPLPATTVGAM